MSENRSELLDKVYKSFIRDFANSMKPFDVDQRIDIYEKMLPYIVKVFNSYPPNEYFETELFDEEQYLREKFLKPYRDKMVPFFKNNIPLYIGKEDKQKKELFKKLNITEPVLTIAEYESLINGIYHFLEVVLDELLQLPPGSQIPEELVGSLDESKADLKELKSNMQGITRKRQSLLLYYLFRALGHEVNPASEDISKLARFAHALFYLPFDNLQKSDIYRHLRKAPHLSADKNLLSDLEYVKDLFKSIDQLKAAELVEKEIESVKKTMRGNKK